MARKNIFTIHQDYEKKPDRNTFDLSFANNLTTKFGQLTPVFLKECSPGDSFRIQPHAAFQFMPMQFPVQTPMRAYLHFFKTRNRTMWKDWMDFIGGTKKNLVHPYVHPVDKKKFYRVGGLADYLGVPNVLYESESGGSSGEGSSSTNPTESVTHNYSDALVGVNLNVASTDTPLTKFVNYSPLVITSFVPDEIVPYLNYNSYVSIVTDYELSDASKASLIGSLVNGITDQILGREVVNFGYRNLDPNRLPNPFAIVKDRIDSYSDILNLPAIPFMQIADFEPLANAALRSMKLDISFTLTDLDTTNIFLPIVFVYRDSDKKVTRVNAQFVKFVNDGEGSLSDGFTYHSDQLIDYSNVFAYGHMSVLMPPLCSHIHDTGDEELNVLGPAYVEGDNSYRYLSAFKSGSTVDVSRVINFDTTDDDGNVISARYGVIGDVLPETPYDSAIRLNAFPFRAYEAVYNAYYRNSVNDPFKPDGVNPEYNKFLPSYEGGEDTFQYDLYFRNWEYDFLTSAIPTPQFGNAPLVGLTSTGEATIEDRDGSRFVVKANIDSDGEITGWTTQKENDPSGSLRMLMSMATTGISINDLRNVNAYQRFLENAIRKGLSYRDQILSHYGVSVRYDELDMPEFIGGASCSIRMNKINQLSEGGDTPLGSFVGQAEAEMHGKHEITEYCDEHGFIIGILSIVPMPVYSQLLPKFFLRSEQLDYYFPEFKHVGYQPIQQKEVSPLQTFYSGGDLNKTFGYNRAFYDLIASTDEVHGQFRTTMRDFIMNRTFGNEPLLGGDFLHVDPDQLNDVFLAGDLSNSDGQNIYAPDADKIIGSMYFEVQKKSPISLYGIAKLE